MEVSSFPTATSRPLHPPLSDALLPQKSWFLQTNCLFPRRRPSTPFLRRTAILTRKQNHSRSQVLNCQSKEVPIVEAGSMDEIYNVLAERLVPVAAAESNLNFKHIVGLCGPPGAGKSTVASEVASRVNELWVQRSSSLNELVGSPEVAIVLPMDGFHLYRHQLDAMKDPKEAYARRGCPWTFDPERFLRCLINLRNKGSVSVPSFDHGVGDPVEDDIFISLQFIDVDIDEAMQRVMKRHMSTGLSPDVAQWRVDYNDRPNAELVMNSKKRADLIIKSVSCS